MINNKWNINLANGTKLMRNGMIADSPEKGFHIHTKPCTLSHYIFMNGLG